MEHQTIHKIDCQKCVFMLLLLVFFSLSYPQFKYKFIYSFIHCALQQTSVSFRFYIAVVLTKKHMAACEHTSQHNTTQHNANETYAVVF